MKLVIGGAFQGKKAYAENVYKVKDGWIDGKTCRAEELWGCKGISNFQEYVRRMLQDPCFSCDENRVESGTEDLLALEQQAEEFAERILQQNPEIIIVSTELGYGVVPVEKSDRIWRESTGRICTALAARAETVVRVVCGIGTRIK